MPDEFHLAESWPYRLAALSERVSRRLSQEYSRSHGLSVAEWRVLVHLGGGEALSVRDIHERAGLEKSRISRAVARLAATGLVAKEAGTGDARLVSLTLTANGRAALETIVPAARAVESRLFGALPAADMAALERVIGRIHAVLDREAVPDRETGLDPAAQFDAGTGGDGARTVAGRGRRNG